MEKIYQAYERTIDGKQFYFIKQYLAFPEYKSVPPLLQQYGMHSDFNKACNIAMVHDAAIQKKLSIDLGIKAPEAKQSRLEIYSYTLKPIRFKPLMLRILRVHG